MKIGDALASLVGSLRRTGVTGRAPPPLPDTRRVGIDPPTVPAGAPKTSEHFQIWPFAKRLDALIRLIRFAAMFALRRGAQCCGQAGLARNCGTRYDLIYLFKHG